MKRLVRVVVAGFALAAAGCTTPPNAATPEALRAYVASGQYDREVADVAARAKTWIEHRVAQRKAGERLAVVFDLDETLLRNWPAIDRENFVYVPAIWDPWVRSGQAAAIDPVREVYRTAKRLGLDVILLTGRYEKERSYTEQNLRAIGCADAAETIFMPDAFKGNAEAFKTAERKRLVAGGRVIIANIGDQESDLAGGFAERTFKVPNPFYFTP